MAKIISEGNLTRGIPLNITKHSWSIPNFDENFSNDTISSSIIKTNESALNPINGLHDLNETGYVPINDFTDAGFTDVQTFILAGIATVIPLLFIVAAILGIRLVWKKYRTIKEECYEGVLKKDESMNPSGKLQGYTLPQELRSSESHFSVIPSDETTTVSGLQLPTPKNNGSIITMTLKNNHLIVETEETTNTPIVPKIESKGTTTKFVTPGTSDFKIEAISEQSSYDVQINNGEQPTENKLFSRDHGALVHCPPEGIEEDIDKRSSNTGLSQSDLSVSSAESHNPSYRYGNQMGYDSGGFGYPEYSGYTMNAQKQSQIHVTHQMKNSTKDDKSEENKIELPSPENMNEKKNYWLKDEIKVENNGDNLSSRNVKAEITNNNKNEKPST